MLEVAEQAPFDAINREQNKLMQQKNSTDSYQTTHPDTRENSKKRWMRVRDSLKLGRIKMALNDSIFSPANRRKTKLVDYSRKGSSSSIIEMHLSTSPHQHCIGNEWTEAFGAIVRDPSGRLQFTKFLESEYSEENILFWWAVEELHESSRNNDGQLAKTVQNIYNTFVAPESSLAINIDHDTRADITERIERHDPASYTDDIFDKAQSHVYRLMEKDCFSRFVHTDVYKELSKQLKLPDIFQFGSNPNLLYKKSLNHPDYNVICSESAKINQT